MSPNTVHVFFMIEPNTSRIVWIRCRQCSTPDLSNCSNFLLVVWINAYQFLHSATEIQQICFILSLFCFTVSNYNNYENITEISLEEPLCSEYNFSSSFNKTTRCFAQLLLKYIKIQLHLTLTLLLCIF